MFKALIFSVLLLPACHKPFWTPPSPSPLALRPDDRRAPFVGSWNIEFRLDSARHAPAPDTMATARGTVTFRDTIIANGPDGLKGLVELDFTPILGRQLSCLHNGEGVFPIRFRRDSVSFDLTPGAADCGLWMTGRAGRDTITGRWAEGGYVCCPSVGRFVMARSK
jgi:hypothetical protein